MHNRLIQAGSLVVAGEPLDLAEIRQPLYAVAAEDDHIAPWAQVFKVVNYVVTEKRFVLSSSGHILGIVNPPAKRRYRADTVHRAAEIAIGDRLMEVLLPGTIVGEMSVVSPGPRSATVTANEDCEFVVIDEPRFNELVQQAPDFALKVMRTLTDRLRRTDGILSV